LVGVLGITKRELFNLLSDYDGDYDKLDYMLAVEDYNIFHTFMFETNKELDMQVKIRSAR